MKSKLLLASLFEKGSLFVSKSILVKYFIEPAEETSIQAAFSVPKRRFKRAVDRNLLKRRILEFHRLNQNLLKTAFLEHPQKISFLYIYKTNRKLKLAEIEQALLPFFKELISKNTPID